MPRISHRDVQWLSAVIAELYAPADMETFARRAVHGLRRLVAANRASIDPINAPLTRVTTIAGEGTPLLPGAEATVSRFLHEHPLVPYFSRYGGRRWRKTTDMTTRRAFRRTALYQEYYRHTGVEYQIGVMFRRPRDGFLALVMNRETRDFSERDRTVLDLLVPYFVQARTAAARLTQLTRDVEGLERGADVANVGFVVLDPERQIRLMTPRACRWLETYIGLARASARVLPRDLDAWVAHQVSRGESLTTPRRSFVVERAGRRLEARLASDAPGSTVILTETLTELPLESLEALGLSRREAEVLKWVAEGKRNAEIDVILGISQATVQHHVERVHRTLGVETRTAAAARARDAAQQG